MPVQTVFWIETNKREIVSPYMIRRSDAEAYIRVKWEGEPPEGIRICEQTKDVRELIDEDHAWMAPRDVDKDDLKYL